MKPAGRTLHLQRRGEGVHRPDVAAMTGPQPASGAEGGESAAPASPQPVPSPTVRVPDAQPRAAPRLLTHTGASGLRRASRRAQEQSQAREKAQRAARQPLRPTSPPHALFISLFFSQRCSRSSRWETISDSMFPLLSNRSPTSWQKPLWHPLKRVHCFLTSPAGACLPHLPPGIRLLRNFLGR